MKKVNCRKVGITLALLFIIGLTVSTIYSRGFFERQKPFVHVTGVESITFTWEFEARGVAGELGELSQRLDRGFDFDIEITVPEEKYIFYMSDLRIYPGQNVDVTFDRHGYAINGVVINRSFMDGEFTLVVAIQDPTSLLYPGNPATVTLEVTLTEEDLTNMIPMIALNQDPFTNQHYIYVVNRRDGMWGREFYVERQDVELSWPERIEFFYNIFSATGFDFRLPIVTWSDQELYDGALVRLWD
ncbi:MAG: hypothetical protein FWB92_09525 [Oscillospiraceae bacterium]|nr:hypothetical protein [Oscillospiraceae bacterium]